MLTKRKYLEICSGVLLAVMSACSVYGLSRDQQPPAGGCSATCLMLKELRNRASAYAPLDSLNIRITYDSSTVIRSMEYVWGEYHPPNMMHVRFTALVATGDTNTVIRTPSDWLAAAGKRLVARSAAEALNVCEEIVYTTSRSRRPGFRPRSYRGPESLNGLPLAIPDAQFLRDSLAVALAEAHGDSEWVVDFWAIEPRNVHRYRCHLGPRYVNIAARDSFPGYGYLIRD